MNTDAEKRHKRRHHQHRQNDDQMSDALDGVRRSEKSARAVDDLLRVDVRSDPVTGKYSASFPRYPEMDRARSQRM